MVSKFELPKAVDRYKTVGLILFMMLLVPLLGYSAQAGPAQEGLSQRNTLPVYHFWLTDPKFSELSTEIVTPHTPWATPYAGESLRLVTIAPRWTQRATVELQQRFDFDAIPIMAYRSHTWGDKNSPHYYWITSGTEAIITERAMSTIGARRRPDVIVIGWMNCSVIPDNVQQEILEAVAEGSGLVIFNPKPLSDKLKALVEKSKPLAADTVNAVVDGLPTGNLPPFKKQNPRDLIGQGVRFYQAGDGGRIAVLDYSPLSIRAYASSLSYLSPPGAEPKYGTFDEAINIQDIHYDYYCSLAGRSILWAADNMPAVQLTGWEGLSESIEGSGSLGELVAAGRKLPQGAIAELTIRDSDSTIEQRSSLEVGPDGRIGVEVDLLKSGGHYADIILRDADGKTLDWGTKYFITNTGAKIATITTDKKSYRPKKPIEVNIVLEGELEGAKLLVEIYDTYERLISTKTVDAQANISMSIDASKISTIQCDVRATLSKESAVLAKHTGKVLLRQPQIETDQYFYGGYGGRSHDFVQKHFSNVMIDHGVNGGLTSGDLDEWASVNTRPTPYVTRYYPDDTEGKGLMVRKPCLSDPELIRSEQEKVIKAANIQKHYSPVGYTLGDDQGMMLTGQDACISETCLSAFRKFLSKHHGDIKKLNASWGTKYSSFDEAMPVSLDDALASGNYPQWAEHRMYMDQLFVDTHIRAKESILSVHPDARVGFEGPLMDDSWYGYEWKKLLDNIDFMAMYPNAWKFDLLRSFGREGLLSGGWYGGYAMYQSEDDLRSYPWFMLFNRCNSYWWFSGYGGSEAGHPAEAVAPDLRPVDAFTLTSGIVRRIQQGIDRLVLNSEPVNDKVAIFFSRPSVHGATVMPAIPTRDYNTDASWSQYLAAPEMKWALNIEANLRLLDDMGLSHIFVDRFDIAAGELQKQGFKLLIMPLIHSLTPAEAKAVREFVKAGGTVLADFRPGVFDKHMKLLKKGQLDDVFGIDRKGSAVTPLNDELIEMATKGGAVSTAEEAGAMLPERVDYGKEEEEDKGEKTDMVPLPIDTTVVTKRGKAAMKTESKSPIFISNKYGKGKANLMNMSVQHYLTLRAAGRGSGLRNLLRNALADSGVAPDVQVQAAGDHSARVRVYRFDNKGDLVVGLLRSHKRLLDESDGFIDKKSRPFIVHFGRTGHIYDIINRKYYGEKDKLELDIPLATAFLFTVLPYEVTAVTAQVRQNEQAVSIAPAVTVSKGKAGRHVINVKVTDANGKRRPEYDLDVVANNGKGVYSFDLALNDPAGQWTIALEDVATGTTAEASVQINSFLAKQLH